jgi:hypothetical protein
MNPMRSQIHNEATIAADGSFVLSDVEMGEYRIRRRGELPSGWYIVDDDGRSTGIVLYADGDDEALELVFKGDGGRVEGIVRTSRGETASWARVGLIRADPTSPEPLQFRATSSDETGAFAIDSVAPGEYYVFASAYATTSDPDPTFLAESGDQLDIIRVNPYSTRTIAVRTRDR